jgi:hypothetical protein
MSEADDHSWDGRTSKSQAAYEKKFEEWHERDWPTWLARHLTFPFTAIREDDEDDAYFGPGARKAPFRLGQKMEVIGLDEEDVADGIMVKVQDKGEVGYVPLYDLKVTPKTNKNYWPVREYAVWFANRY